jgi:hypothetical protein
MPDKLPTGWINTTLGEIAEAMKEFAAAEEVIRQ